MRLDHRGSIGAPTFDRAHYSAPLSPMDRVEAFAGGLYVFELPRMEHVQAVHAPGIGGDVLLHIREPMHLDRTVSPEIPDRVVKARTLVLIPEGVATDWYSADGQPLCYHIHVPRALREQLAEDVGQSIRPILNESTREIDALFTAIGAELRGSDAFRRLKMQGLALSTMAACFRLSSAGAPRANSQAMTPARLRRVRAYIEENLTGEVCLEDMAGCVGLSPSHFCRAFRAETGMSPYAWVVQARVERVKGQLLNSRKSLAEIALDCGFASQSHMTQTFSRTVGIPPARWRREVRQ